MSRQRTVAAQYDPDYQAYLLRMWRDEVGRPWRAAVVFVATGEERCFNSLPELYAFLDARTGRGTASPQQAR